ncbi:SDR family oxidoreductase [Mesorhizobium sp. B2-5-4]|nr:SDR family oxidoreductase [Mesorhizobium sp. B2-5-4]
MSAVPGRPRPPQLSSIQSDSKRRVQAAFQIRVRDAKRQSGQTTSISLSLSAQSLEDSMEGLAGKVALITGAGRGIGRLAALRLARGGARVALVSRSMDQLNNTLEHIEARGGSGIVIAGDVASAESVASIKSEVEARLGPPSILVNAAGIFGPIQLVWKTDPAAWINTVMINTIGPYLTSRAFVEDMVRKRWGRIVNITSAAALHEPGPINSAYGTSKAALNQFTRHLAAELEGTGVTANVIHPGDVKTEMWADIRDGVSDLGPVAERYREWAAWVERTGGDDPEKASELIERLMGENAAHINGRFLWIKNGLQLPIPSWGEFKPAEAWESS